MIASFARINSLVYTEMLAGPPSEIVYILGQSQGLNPSVEKLRLRCLRTFIFKNQPTRVVVTLILNTQCIHVLTCTGLGTVFFRKMMDLGGTRQKHSGAEKNDTGVGTQISTVPFVASFFVVGDLRQPTWYSFYNVSYVVFCEHEHAHIPFCFGPFWA